MALARGDQPMPPPVGPHSFGLSVEQRDMGPVASPQTYQQDVSSRPFYHQQAAVSAHCTHAEPNSEDCREQGNAPRRMAHRLSLSSQMAIDKLTAAGIELSQIEDRVDEISSSLASSLGQDIARIKSELAQLESRAKQLEGTGIDDVYTHDLHSGKQIAKDEKRGMLLRFEALYANIERTFGLSAEQRDMGPVASPLTYQLDVSSRPFYQQQAAVSAHRAHAEANSEDCREQ